MFASKSSKSYQRFFTGSSTNNQSSSKVINALMIITLKTSMIFRVCIQIFGVSSMLLQRVVNESSRKKQWIMNESEVNITKTMKIKKASNENNNASNMSLQIFINESSTKRQWNINVSEISTKRILSLRFASKSSKSDQRFFTGSSTINQSSSKGINVLTIITLETSMIFSVCIQTFVVSSMFLQGVINESSLKDQWNINVSEVNEGKTIKIKKVTIETINISDMSLQSIINESSRKR